MNPLAVVISNPTVGAELGHLGEWLDARGFTVRRLIRDDVLPIDAADDVAYWGVAPGPAPAGSIAT